MRAVTFQGVGEVRVEEKPDPQLLAPDDAIVRVEASGICGSDLHIYHGRVKIDPGFIIGHEFVGEVVAAGDEVSRVEVGDRVLGTYCTACGQCFFCTRGEFHKCDEGRVFGHGETLGSLQGAQAELLLVPHANVGLRGVPDGLSDDLALFAGDVMGTGYHAVASRPLAEGESAAVLGLGPVGLCAVQAARAAGASTIVAVDTVDERLAMAGSFGAVPVHLTEGDPRGEVKRLTEGRGVDLAVDAVGHPDALELACRLARKAGTVSATGVYAERIELHMGVVWIKALTLETGHANVIKHVDPVLEMLSDGRLDPGPLVTHHMNLDEAPEAYAVYDNREALKIVLAP
ncbi:MAG TPA: alcohol dehydrogenase catalytic domain-containing protein [Solirubrobacterales bacterium]|nr:alcohol dehydrogenase catalytic domain-containing protein [Solirubrobacterales bacterium]